MDHLQPVTSTSQMVSVGSVSSIPASVQSLKPNEQMRFHEPMAHFGARPQFVTMHDSVGYMIPNPNYSCIQQLDVPNHDSREIGPILSHHRLHHVQMAVKREFPIDNIPRFPRSPRSPMPNKKPRQMYNRPWLNPMLASNKNSPQLQAQSATIVLSSQKFVAPNKKTNQLQATPAKSGSQKATTPRSHTTQGQLSQMAQSESNESVRLKFRESISYALALVTPDKDKSSTTKTESHVTAATTSELLWGSSQTVEIASPDLVAENTGEKSKEATGICPTQKENNVGSELSLVASNVGGSTVTEDCVGQELNTIDLLPEEEESLAGNFFGKDDLLQGNGLSWVLDFDAWVAENEGHDTKKQNIGGAGEVKRMITPQGLALKIEFELFKLFDGVNKKYKEKARSLLFNLKDKNNPELREKVMAGEISPARLCSMTAEELASKELTEWRIAKAEEFEQMKILPDTDIDIRRLVRKTHKGEFQVEVEEDDASVELSVGSSSLPQVQTKDKRTTLQPVHNTNGAQEDLRTADNSSEKQDAEDTLTIPSIESTDLMQGLIEDELKDAEFLPPIVSLDEFMVSLHSEPPFENLPKDAEKAEANLDNDNSDRNFETKSDKHSPDSQTNATSKVQDDLDVKDQTPDAAADANSDANSVDNQPQPAVAPLVALLEEPLWEGSLQLSITSSIAVSGFFKRGEKARTEDWPRTLEIKGRVRLDAFEKFLQDLYKSRSRSIMVMRVILKDAGKESEALSQVEDSYVADDRVGFAEPLKGVEVYLCPHHPKVLDRVGKHLDQTEALALSGDEKGFVGVIVWRKAHVAPPRNSSSSHHKHSYKKHQQEHYSSSRRHNHHHHQDRNINVNASSSNLALKNPVVPLVSSKTSSQSVPMKVPVEDDLPPGFGPQASQDEDDLPEFNFSGGLSRSVPAQKPAFSQSQNRPPSDQMRHLIQKYGRIAAHAGPVVKSSKDDDDDDIPEWQPQIQVPLAADLQPIPLPQVTYQPLNQPMLQHLINQQQQRLGSPMHHTQAALPLQNSVPTWPPQQQQTGGWMNPQAPQQGQCYGSQSKGF